MLTWLAGRRSPSGAHLLTDDPLAALSGPADKHNSIYAVSRVNPMFKEEAWPGGVRPTADDRTGWQRSAAAGSSYWHEPPPDSSLQLDAAAAAAGPPDSLEPPPASPVAERRFVEYRGSPPPPGYAELAEVHRGVMSLHRGMELPRGLRSGRPATLPRPVWPASVGDPPASQPPRCFSVSGRIRASSLEELRPPPFASDGRLSLGRRSTTPPTLSGSLGRLPSIPDEEIEPSGDVQLDSIVTESLIQLTTPRSTPASSLRDAAREGDSRAGSTASAASFRWEGGPVPPPGGFGWERTLEPLLRVLREGEGSPAVLRRGAAGGQLGNEAAVERGSEGGVCPGPPSRGSSELSQLYAELAAPRPPSRPLSEGLYAWPTSPPVPVPATHLHRPPPRPRSDSPPPAYLNQLLPSDTASSRSLHSAIHRTPSDAQSEASRDSRLSGGSRSRLLPSDSSEGGSERRVTFSADTVDNEPGPARPRPRRLPERAAGPGRRTGTVRGGGGFYAANLLTRLKGGSGKTGQKKELEFRNFTLDVGRAAALRRQAAHRWRSRHLCSAVTVVLVLVLLGAAGVLVFWLWTTERRLFQV